MYEKMSAWYTFYSIANWVWHHNCVAIAIDGGPDLSCMVTSYVWRCKLVH